MPRFWMAMFPQLPLAHSALLSFGAISINEFSHSVSFISIYHTPRFSWTSLNSSATQSERFLLLYFSVHYTIALCVWLLYFLLIIRRGIGCENVVVVINLIARTRHPLILVNKFARMNLHSSMHSWETLVRKSIWHFSVVASWIHPTWRLNLVTLNILWLTLRNLIVITSKYGKVWINLLWT